MGERIHDHTHHDESWHDELHIRKSPNLTDTRSDELTEYDIVECRRDDGWDDRLPPHADESGDLLANDG